MRWSKDRRVLEIFASGKKILSENYIGSGVSVPDEPANVGFNYNRVRENDYYRGKMD
ncbi:hypothetical protein H8S90_10955 [Olivibacter sp. SDN3]|uniref:hypothetical protein n=1 Tax=Olivibacter sp. SDN3 TaxID=2764720 RepID=UPI00165173DC|nr:hypothetical protein [Olivibacter sp. SDN3]QNL52041.1 hypothetical protein H8S90_10955 [Olivibacter sp. SDN3]